MKIALLIIDMQNDFVQKEGVLCVDGAYSTIPLVKKLLDFARNKSWNVIHVIREHDKYGINVDKTRRHLFENGKKGYCVAGTFGAQIIDELKPIENEIVLKKSRNSAFFGTNLNLLLKRLGVEKVIVAGTQYPNCIRATANDAMSFDYDVTVVTDCCSAKTKEVELSNIYDLKNLGIECVPLSFLMEK